MYWGWTASCHPTGWIPTSNEPFLCLSPHPASKETATPLCSVETIGMADPSWLLPDFCLRGRCLVLSYSNSVFWNSISLRLKCFQLKPSLWASFGSSPPKEPCQAGWLLDQSSVQYSENPACALLNQSTFAQLSRSRQAEPQSSRRRCRRKTNSWQVQAGWDFEQPFLIAGVPAHRREAGIWWSLKYLPTQTRFYVILWFYDKPELLAFPGDLAGLLATFFVPRERCAAFPASWQFIRGWLHVAAPVSHQEMSLAVTALTPSQGTAEHGCGEQTAAAAPVRHQVIWKPPGKEVMQIGVPARIQVPHGCLVVCTA